MVIGAVLVVIGSGATGWEATAPGRESLDSVAGLDVVDDVFAAAVSNGCAYLAAGYDGLVVIDVSDPNQPVEIGWVDTRGFAGGVALMGGLVLVADGYHGLRVIDVENPVEPGEIGRVAIEGWSNDVAALGEYALVAAGTAGLVIVDLSDTSYPVEVASMKIDGGASRVHVADPCVCVTDEWGRVHTIDMNEPIRPVETELVDPRDGEDGAPVTSDTVCVVGWMSRRGRPSLTWIDAMVFGEAPAADAGGSTPFGEGNPGDDKRGAHNQPEGDRFAEHDCGGDGGHGWDGVEIDPDLL